MDKINIEKTEKTPNILFDPEKGIFEMKGNSRPEDVRTFYYPVLEALRTYFDQLTEQGKNNIYDDVPFKGIFQLQYFNSSSAKFIADILLLLKEFADKNTNIEIQWYYEEGDDDMKEVGTDLSEMIKYDFKFIEVTK